jgi:serine/threonine protein kinase
MVQNLGGGRYELGPVLGTGGMARVCRATDTVLGRPVAVKVFREDLDEDSAARVRTEMQTLASLSHPGLVGVHDAGIADGTQAYLVMELVEGPTLAACCLDGSLTPERVAEVGAQLADALAYVHSRGVVHRDVKPANILLSEAGAKLADFGIARIVDGVRHTGTGLTVGTAPYLAPEQVTGEPVASAADVYALGLVLLECLTGQREFTGGPVETALARLHRQPDVPDSLPAPFPSVLRAMTARDPANRPTAEQAAALLRGEVAPDTSTRVLEQPQTQVLTAVGPTTGQTAAGPITGPVARTRVARVVPKPAARQDRPQWQRAALDVTRGTATRVALAAAGVLVMVAAFSAAGSGSTPTTTPLDRHLSELEKSVSR